MSTLQKIQSELKAPKGQFNSFGKYKYRSCEDILEAVKPILAKYEAEIRLSDEIVNIGNRFYVKATASFTSKDGEGREVSAYAREPEEKKGMDESQITGTASSYARKYALNGLLLIDDTKDEDTNELREEKTAKANAKITAADAKSIRARLKDIGKSEEGMCEFFKIKKIEEMTVNQMVQLNQMLNNFKGEKK